MGSTVYPWDAALSEERPLGDAEFEELMQQFVYHDYPNGMIYPTEEVGPPGGPGPSTVASGFVEPLTAYEDITEDTASGCMGDAPKADKVTALERELEDLKRFVEGMRESLSCWTSVINKIVANFVEERWMSLEPEESEAIRRWEQFVEQVPRA